MKSSPCTATFSTTASWTGWTNCSLATSSLTRPSTSETLPVIGNIRDTAEAMELRDRDPLGHHVTNIVVTEQTDSEPHVRSKGIGGMTDGRSEPSPTKTLLFGPPTAGASAIASASPAASHSPAASSLTADAERSPKLEETSTTSI